MVHFNLKRESPYVVPALRAKQTTDQHTQHKRLQLIKTCAVVLIAHAIAITSALFVLPNTGNPQTTPKPIEAVLIEQSALSTTPKQQSSSHVNSTTDSTNKSTHSTPTPPSVHQTTTDQPTSPTSKSIPATPPSATPLQVGSDMSINSSTAQISSSANQASCAQFTRLNKKYPSTLTQSNTVTLFIRRNAQGSVTHASITQTSGDQHLDQFALNSARAARFKPNPDCDGRNFSLPILFKANIA